MKEKKEKFTDSEDKKENIKEKPKYKGRINKGKMGKQMKIE